METLPRLAFVTSGLAMVPALSGCAGWQSALDPRGPEAEGLRDHLLLFASVSAVTWLLVMAVLAAALLRRRQSAGVPDLRPDAGSERRAGRAVAAGTAATVLVLAGLTAASFLATRSYEAEAADALPIRVTGFQWWWEVTYPDPRPGGTVVTANEIHVPVGRPVRIELAANDVIHSFWIPSLAGKRDMIPGRDTALVFTARREGVYRGQCAEFCGIQHAHMAMIVVAQAPDAFERWRAEQAAPAAAPDGAEAREGLALLTRRNCAACHTVRGTSAAGTAGPDLTHVASRATIAAGLLPVTRGTLAAWIADPQTIKPGNLMPMTSLAPDELRAVAAYLAGLR
jgi:cytochrome c oxidase subunit 2